MVCKHEMRYHSTNTLCKTESSSREPVSDDFRKGEGGEYIFTGEKITKIAKSETVPTIGAAKPDNWYQKERTMG
jgi:hypothetical protein